MTEWKLILKMPAVDRPHAAVLAFLRTSEWGEWQVSDDEQNDPFVQHFQRGKSGKVAVAAAFGGGAGLKNPLDRCFTRLRTTFRPSPDFLTIGLYYSVPYGLHSGGPVYKRMAEYVEAEAKALAVYLQEFYGLPEVPQIAAE